MAADQAGIPDTVNDLIAIFGKQPTHLHAPAESRMGSTCRDGR